MFNLSLKQWGALALVVLAAAGLGVAYSRYLSPARVETKEVVRVVTDTKVVEVVKEVKVRDTNVNRRTRTVVTPGPNGPTIVRETEVITKERSTSNTDSERTSEAHTNTASEKISVRDKNPDWRVKALFGTTLPKPEILYGAQVERRLLGPVWIGVWGLYGAGNGVVGGSVGLEF